MSAVVVVSTTRLSDFNTVLTLVDTCNDREMVVGVSGLDLLHNVSAYFDGI